MFANSSVEADPVYSWPAILELVLQRAATSALLTLSVVALVATTNLIVLWETPLAVDTTTAGPPVFARWTGGGDGIEACFLIRSA